MDKSLIQYNAARKALAAARSTDEVKSLRTKAEMLRAYAEQTKDRQMEIDAVEIRLRSERRLGELIKEQKATVGLNPGAKGNPRGRGAKIVRSHNGTAQPTLESAGIDKKLSSRAQKLAAIPEKQFESRISKWRDDTEKHEKKPVSVQLLHSDKPKTINPTLRRSTKSAKSTGSFSPSIECFFAVESILTETFYELNSEDQDDLIGRLQQLVAQLEADRRRTA
jgi:hypothetical protein